MNPVQCRPQAYVWLWVILLDLFMSLPFMFSTFGKALTPLEIVFAVPMVPSLLLVIWLLRARLVADDTGLRWRNWGGWQHTVWEDITDYYRQPSKKHAEPVFVIETRRGRWQAESRYWSAEEIRAVCEEVQQRAVRAKTQEWMLLGSRPADWPRTFDYRAGDRKWLLYLAATSTAGIVTLVMRPFRHSPGLHLLGFATGVSGKDTCTICIVTFVMTLAVVFFLLVERQRVNLRSHERITVSEWGIRWQNAGTVIDVPWSAVMDYHKAGGVEDKRIVITTNGTFRYDKTLENADGLSAAIVRCASQSEVREWGTLKRERRTSKSL